MPEWMLWLTYVAAGMTALGVIWRKLVLPAFKTLRAGIRAWDEASELLPIVREMAAEFKPNDGDSLRDRVDLMYLMVAENQTALETRIIDHDHYHEGIEHRLRAVEESS